MTEVTLFYLKPLLNYLPLSAQIFIQIFLLSFFHSISIEGQRKAHYEECDAEKKNNVEKIRELKKVLKEMYVKEGTPLTVSD